MTTEKMLYRRYKQHFADCETVPGSYDPASKTIEVLLPEGRLKPSGTRGKRFHWLTFHGVEIATGRTVRCTIKATCTANAVKRLDTSCIWDV